MRAPELGERSVLALVGKLREVLSPDADPTPGQHSNTWEAVLIQAVDTARTGPLCVQYGDLVVPSFLSTKSVRHTCRGAV